MDGADTAPSIGCMGVGIEDIVKAASESGPDTTETNTMLESDEDGPGPHVIVKDPSDFEDSNGGIYLVKNSRLGRLFMDLVNDKDNWPGTMLGGGCYPE